MIKTLFNIGKILIEKEPEWFEPWQNPYHEQDAIVLIAEFEDLLFKGELKTEVLKKNNLKFYLYKKFTKDANIVPTFRVTDARKTFDRFVKCVEKYHTKKFGFEDIPRSKIQNAIKERYNSLKEKLLEFEIKRNKNFLFTIKFDKQWLGEDEYFLKFFIKDYLKSYYLKNYSGEVNSISKNKYCALTEKQDTVYGFVDTLGFTVDSISFMRNGFNQSDAYKMFPVSEEAIIILEGAKNLSFSMFSKSFFGLKYVIIPHFINVNNLVQQEIIETYLIKASQDMATLEDESKTILGSEKLIYDIIEEDKLSKSGIYYDIFFYQQNKNQTLIKSHISDVLPFQFAKIFKTKKQIERQYEIITRWENKENNTFKYYYLNFSNIKNFFSEKRKEKGKEITLFHPFFFKIVVAVFYNSSLNEDLVLRFFVEKITSTFKKRNEKWNSYSQTYKKSLVIYQFFRQLGLFTKKNQNNMEENRQVALTMEEFIEQHKILLDSDYAKGVFVLGCLVKRLLKIQKRHHNLDNTSKASFTKRLNNLVLNDNEIIRIYYEVEAKRLQFKQYYSPFDEALSKKAFALLAEKNSTKPISNDKIRYLFAGGLVMEDEFSKEAKRRKNIEKEKGKQTANAEN